MKKILLMIISLSICGMMTLFAQNNRISYQAVVRNSANQLIVNTELTVEVSLANSENGTAVYSERHTVTSNANGLISLLIGNGVYVSGNWNNIDWASAWVTTWIYEGQEMLASHKTSFSAVPYAMYAGYADSVNQTQIANYINQHHMLDDVQSDWDMTDPLDRAYILNKPNISDSIYNYLQNSTLLSRHLENTINKYNIYHNELMYSDLSVMQSDWNETNQAKTSYIKNKPNISDSVGNYLTTNRYVNENNICATIESNCTNVPLKSDSNNYTSHNDFTEGSITVPSNPDAIVRPSTFDASCDNMNAVNVCDLLAMFDSLNNKIKGVYDSLKRLNDSLAEELTNLKNSFPPSDDAPTIKNLSTNTLTVKANNISPVTPITSYKYCYSTNSDMSGAICQTSTFDTLDLDGLLSNTDYYFTVEATNSAGSTTSKITFAHTHAHAPTAVVTDPLSPEPAGFKVEVIDIDPKERKDATTVQICYKEGTSCSVDDGDYTCAEAQSVDVDVDNTNTQLIDGLISNTTYCVIVKVSNGDSTTIYGPFNVTTGNVVTMSITSTGNGNINFCGKTSVPATYTAIPSNGPENYTYSWNGGTDIEANTFTKSYTTAGTYTVTCTATHKTEGYTLTATATTTVGNSGMPVTLGLCDNFLTVTVKKTSGNPNTISWGDGSTSNSVIQGSTDHLYNAAGTYTIIASNTYGCSDTVSMTLGDAVHTTCTLSELTTNSLLTNEMGTSTAIDSVKDHEGNWYEVVQIGSQCWLKENVRTTTSPRTGTRIVVNGPVLSNVSKVACWIDNDSATYAPKNYGLLYNWMAAVDTFYTDGSNSEVANVSQPDATVPATGFPAFYLNFTGHRRGICPEGWHLPSDAEWSEMEIHVDIHDDLGEITGYRGTHSCEISGGCDWGSSIMSDDAPGSYDNPNRNSTGFSALPAGNFTDRSASFDHIGGHAGFWTSTQVSKYASYFRGFGYDYNGVNRGTYSRFVGHSVRCVRD